MKRIVLTAVFAVLTAAPAFAHPGHGVDGSSNTLLHYIATPEHIGIALAAVLVAAGLFMFARRRAR
jgi:hydrogenase/urease accessory protein HupE